MFEALYSKVVLEHWEKCLVGLTGILIENQDFLIKSINKILVEITKILIDIIKIFWFVHFQSDIFFQ